MTSSRELLTLSLSRGETAELVASGDNGCEVYRWSDNTTVITTNGDLVTEDDDGFAELLAETMGN